MHNSKNQASVIKFILGVIAAFIYGLFHGKDNYEEVVGAPHFPVSENVYYKSCANYNIIENGKYIIVDADPCVRGNGGVEYNGAFRNLPDPGKIT